MDLLSLTLPGGQSIEPPGGISGAQGGLPMLGKIVGNSLTILLTVGIIITLFVVILSGMQWVRSEGNPQKVAAARSRLTWGVVGLVVMLSTFLIISIVGYVFNVDLLAF